jgi:hypothetical protein
MATESIGKTVYMDNDFADRFIEAMERTDKNPAYQGAHKIRWGDPDEIAKAIRKKYSNEE